MIFNGKAQLVSFIVDSAAFDSITCELGLLVIVFHKILTLPVLFSYHLHIHGSPPQRLPRALELFPKQWSLHYHLVSPKIIKLSTSKMEITIFSSKLAPPPLFCFDW